MSQSAVAHILKVLATVLIFAILAYRVDLDALFKTIGKAPAGTIFLGVFFGLLVMLASGIRWRLISGYLRVPLPTYFAVLSYMESICFNLILPGSMAGDAMRIAKVTKSRGYLRRNLAAVLFDRAANLGILLVLCFPAGLLMWGVPGMENLMLVIVFLVALSMIAFCALVFSSRLRSFRRYRLIRELVYLSMMSQRLIRVRSRVIWIGLLSFCAQGLAIAMLACATEAVGIDQLSLTELTVATFLALLAAALPFTIAGFGLREGALIWTLEIYGVDSTRALAAAVVFTTLLLLQVFPGLIIWVLGIAKLPQVSAKISGKSSARD